MSRSDDSIGGPVGDHVAALTPYARSLGIAVDRYEDGVPVITVPFASGVEGRPGHFHGGATSGVLETAGYAALRCALTERGVQPQLKPINITDESGLTLLPMRRTKITSLCSGGD